MPITFKNLKKIKIEWTLYDHKKQIASNSFWSRLFGASDLELVKTKWTKEEGMICLHLQFKALRPVTLTSVRLKISSDTFVIEKEYGYPKIRMDIVDTFDVNYQLKTLDGMET